jgi:hypothetical protein
MAGFTPNEGETVIPGRNDYRGDNRRADGRVLCPDHAHGCVLDGHGRQRELRATDVHGDGLGLLRERVRVLRRHQIVGRDAATSLCRSGWVRALRHKSRRYVCDHALDHDRVRSAGRGGPAHPSPA